uniref:Uncharacterized protein n=1 Tax=Ditylenchus dipsaci TaxID=166011 RepID=A0A915DZ84_9BILA
MQVGDVLIAVMLMPSVQRAVQLMIDSMTEISAPESKEFILGPPALHSSWWFPNGEALDACGLEFQTSYGKNASNLRSIENVAVRCHLERYKHFVHSDELDQIPSQENTTR